MKKSLIIAGALFFMGIGYAFAQSTALPIVLGFLTTSGCAGSFTTCWQPFTQSTPLQLISN